MGYIPEARGKYKFMIGEKVKIDKSTVFGIGEVVGIGRGARTLFRNIYRVYFPLLRANPDRGVMEIPERQLERMAYVSSLERLFDKVTR